MVKQRFSLLVREVKVIHETQNVGGHLNQRYLRGRNRIQRLSDLSQVKTSGLSLEPVTCKTVFFFYIDFHDMEKG